MYGTHVIGVFIVFVMYSARSLFRCSKIEISQTDAQAFLPP